MRPVRVRQFLREYGFHGVERVGGLQLDWALITALVERWRPETHSFHLPFGEVGITLQDVEVLLGLPVDGNPLAGMTGRSRDQWIQICEDMKGFRPRTSDITSTMIKMSAIVPKELTDQSLDVDYLQHARAIMFKLLGGSLFPNTTRNRVSLYLLEIIMGDANIVRGRAIGSAVLSYLYRSMCRASATSAAQIGGCLVLLQLWAWERLPMTRPRGVIPLDQLVDVPYGVRWMCYHRWSDCTTHSIRAYRDQLDRLLEGEFVWMPYPNLETLPPYCSAGVGIWISKIPLIYAYVVEMYYPDRFCRQFNALQHVPQVVVYDRHLHQIKSNVMQIGDGERQYLEMWEGRYDATVHMEFGMVDATPQYRQWYYLRGRRQIGNPAHPKLELQTALYCMADCSQRLDPGRHPDGFIPSHEVLRVHELLTECVRALGHASILDHPQEQHAYNPGHIRRRVDRRRDAPAVGVRRGGRGSRRLQVDDEDVHIPIQSPPMTQDDDDEDDAHWNGEIQTLNSEVQYSELPKKSLLFNSDISYDTFLGQITSDVLEDGFQGVESVYGKFPRHQSGVYVGSRPLPINDEPTWRHFIRKASREYDVVEVFIGVSKNVEEETDGNPFFHQQMDQPSSSHFPQHVDGDPDDAEYIAPSTEDEKSSEDEEDISTDEGEDGQDIRAIPQLHDRQSHVPNMPLRPTFHIPIIEVGNRYPSFQSLQQAVSLRNIAEHRHFHTEAKRSRYWKARCVYAPQCTWFIQAAENAGCSIWTIKQYQGYHQCRPDYTRAKDDKLLTSELISGLIGPKIEEDADYKVKLIMRDVYELFQVSVSYKKACCAKSLAIQRLYGSWEDSYNKLAPLLGAIMGSNQGTVVDLQTLPTNAPTTFQFRRTNGYLWQQSGYNFPMNVWKKIKHNEENRLYCRVVQHHAQHGIYSVVVDGSFNNGHRETFAVNLNARTCTCGYWSYINAYSGILMPLPDEANWPTPGYEIVRPTARARTQTGRPTRTRYPNNMDYRPRRRRNEQ
ncbi:unnamed protein product [Cuscuta campestris]|uniref:Aminotransferase-like plant mobile domain-containing protein n=1 Tax=Cuscuta campestris TaxID=132261 RepID=A0A484KJ42_9ASTE|nr:unnamed protein product [Cuscuta campestris]